MTRPEACPPDRPTARSGIPTGTVKSLPIAAGEACGEYHHRTARDLNARRVGCDGIWAFRHARRKDIENAKSAAEDADDVPDMDRIGTSHVERHGLTMRMGVCRFTRLTDMFLRKPENHIRMRSLFAVNYSFARVHGTLGVTPAMAAGVTDMRRDMDRTVGLIDARTKPERGYRSKKSTRYATDLIRALRSGRQAAIMP